MASFDWQRFFASASSGGASAVQALDQRRDQLKQEAQKTEYFRKLVALENPDLADAVKIMGGPEIQAVHDATVAKRLQKTRALQDQALEINLRSALQQEAARRDEEAQLPVFMNALASRQQQIGTPRVEAQEIPGMPMTSTGTGSADFSRAVAEAMRESPAGFRAFTALPDDVRKTSLRELLGSGVEPPVLPVEQNYGNRKLLINPKSGSLVADLTPEPPPPEIPPGFVATGATLDKDGKLALSFKPESEGNALTQGEISQVAALNQAEQDLDRLEKIYQDLGPDWGGPVSGRAKAWLSGGQNANVAAVENAIVSATPNLARGVFREVGVLTDEDIRRYQKLLPSPYDTDAVRARKIKQLRERITQGKREMMDALKSAGRKVEGFGKDAAPAAPKRFDSEVEARAAGGKAGDIIELYDPATATYRKARLK